ncbi:hypothetical protein A0256_18080 [Mucilaginibacter sp. PAMC 26640]|nr:hypothetical protein A0256_18080 [Mucilaginibacter sp. PAMC 26640]
MESAGIYNRCDRLLNELYIFDGDLLHLGTSIIDDRLRLFEKNIGFYLPLDFEYMLTLHNGISLMGTEVYGIDDRFSGPALNKIYQFEHFEAGNPMPAHFMPFSPDGAGNHYCLDLAKVMDGLCPVIFWQHDFEYHSLDAVEICNSNFMDWFSEVLIDWTLEDYNYDGSEK